MILKLVKKLAKVSSYAFLPTQHTHRLQGSQPPGSVALFGGLREAVLAFSLLSALPHPGKV